MPLSVSLAGTTIWGSPRAIAEASKSFLKRRWQVISHPGRASFRWLKPTPKAKIRWGAEVRGLEKSSFVVLVFIRYPNWIRDSNKKTMQLNSVEADLVLLLDHLKYIHEDPERAWYFLLDFDYKYTDLNGETSLLPRIEPTKDATLSTLEMVSQNRRSGLVYYGGHGERGLPGTGELVRSESNFIYKEIVADASAPVEIYLLTTDAQRISSQELFSRLPDNQLPGCVLTVVLDACHAEGLLTFAGVLPYVYDGSTERELDDPTRGSTSQRVVVTAARVGELAGTLLFKPTATLYGALTWTMVSWISKHPQATATDVAKKLKHVCETAHQHPRISAQHSLVGPFQLLPPARASFGQVLQNNK